jgi:hypothetical protein
MGQNGVLTSAFDGSLPTQVGEALSEGDLVGLKTDGTGKIVAFKATNAVTGQLAAVGVMPRDIVAGGFESIRRNGWRIALPTPLPTLLNALKPGDPVYLGAAGAMTQTATSTEDELLQQVGIAYWTGDLRRGQPTDGLANGVLIEITNEGSVIPGA